MDENLEWLTQNTEDLKSNKGNLTPPLPPTHTHINPSPTFQVFPLFLAKHFVPPPLLNQILEGPTPAPL